MLTGILGAGAASVRHLSPGPQRRVEIRYPDRQSGVVVVGAAIGVGAAWLPFYASAVTEKSVVQYTADAGKLYRRCQI